MTVNYYIKCPICNSVTRMRSPAGYVYSTPVRVHCGKCNTLLTGEFISDNENVKAYYIPVNCEDVRQQEYDYYGEASGEMLCSKIFHLPGGKDDFMPPKLSPIFAFLHSKSLEENKRFIDFVCYSYEIRKNWDTHKIKYDLFLNKQYDLIRQKYEKDAKANGYVFNSDFDVLRYIYYSCFYDFGGVFKAKNLRKIFIEVNYQFRHLNAGSLQDYISYLDTENRLEIAQQKLFSVIFSFVKVSSYLMPAVGANLSDNPSEINRDELGITTCTFEDIKHFYQDSFECFSEYCDIVIGLDNIMNRGAYDAFVNAFDMKKFREQKKGNRINNLPKEEFFTKQCELTYDSNELRNSIGHNDFMYDGISQKIMYKVLKTGETKVAFLLDVAIECVKLMQSVYLLLFFVYELQRYKYRLGTESVPMNILFYSATKSQDRCPCGSGKKYKDCCKSFVTSQKTRSREYPNKSDMEY